MLFLMLVATYLFQVGLVALLAKDFKPFALISLMYFASLLAYGGVKMVRTRPHLQGAGHSPKVVFKVTDGFGNLAALPSKPTQTPLLTL